MPFKLNPLTGQLDLVNSSSGSSSDNFSYEQVVLAVTITIPIYQQMIVHDNINIDGTLIMNGTLVII